MVQLKTGSKFEGRFFVGMGFEVKAETETVTPAAKKRKTEWQNALKKLPGDTAFAKEGYVFCHCFWF